MIRVTIEFVPFGDELLARQIGVGIITNTGKGTPELGAYQAGFMKDGVLWAESKFDGFERQKKNAWELLREALNAIAME